MTPIRDDCSICREPLSGGERAIVTHGRDVHARCVEAGEHLVGLAAEVLAAPRGAVFCGACLAAELATSELEIRSAVWHVGRQVQISRGRCGCGAEGWRLV